MADRFVWAAENELPMRTGRLSVNYVPDASKMSDIESMAACDAERPKPLGLVSMKPDGRFSEGMSRTALAGFERLDAAFHEQRNYGGDAFVERGVAIVRLHASIGLIQNRTDYNLS